jgi:putative glutamine amidotransferase
MVVFIVLDEGALMTYPMIGVTTMRRQNEYGRQLVSVAEAYVAALTQAGICPVLIPNQLPESAVDELLVRLDGILFTGGGDIAADFYQEEQHPKIGGVERDRDQLELHLLKRVVEEGLPFMGICRGLQLVNVGLGGSLFADITEQVPGATKHDYYPDWERDYLAHSIQVQTDSRLHSILGAKTIEVNSLHHQAIRQVAPDLVPTAYAPDGIVEAVELRQHPFGLAVQWHPEWLTAHRQMRDLFSAFAEAASIQKQPAAG